MDIITYPSSYDSNYAAYSVSNLDNGLTDSSSSTYARINLTRGNNAQTYIYYNFSVNIPADAIIDSVSCSVKCRMYNGTYSASRTAQLYSGSTAKGSATTLPASTTPFALECGSWTASELSNIKLGLHATRSSSSNTQSSYFNFYGATLTVSYTIPSTGDKIFIKVNGTWKEEQDVKVKNNGTWLSVSKAYKMVSGSWVEQSDKSSMFDPNALYLKG